MIKINENLTLNYVDENMVKGNKLVSMECWFTFFNESYCVYIGADSLEDEELRIFSTEGPSVLFDSFESQLEEVSVIDAIRLKAKEFLIEFNLENDED